MTSSMDPTHKHGAASNVSPETSVPSRANSVRLTASLRGNQEVPPSSSTATGSSTLTLNAAGNALSYKLTVSGLDFGQVLNEDPSTPDTRDDVTLIHIHNNNRGANGPVALNLFQAGQTNQDEDDFKIVQNADDSVTISGIWEATDQSSIPLNNFVNQIRNADPNEDIGLYWNVHTTQFPNGAIRGQLQRSQSSADSLTGTRGNDRLIGTTGDDRIRGLAGNDRINGRAGDDRIDGGTGRNVVIGGDGADVFTLNTGRGVTIIKDFSDEDRLQLSRNLEFDDLTIRQQGRTTVIKAGRDEIGRLFGVDADTVTEASFA